MESAGDQPAKVESDGSHPPPDPACAAAVARPDSPQPDRRPASHKTVTWSSELTTEAPPPPAPAAATDPDPYVTAFPAQSASLQSRMESVKDALMRWGRRAGEATKKAEDLSRNTWQHLKTGPSFTEAAMGMIAQGTKVIAEGGYDRIFRQTFETLPEEQLRNSYACYLSTSAGPVMGILYLSTAKLAFCSDNPLSYKVGDKTEWSYYKVVIPLDQLRAANPSASNVNPAEKYIQIISLDDHEFWFMGFLNYEGAVASLQDALISARDLQV